jgi:hypothetical protein
MNYFESDIIENLKKYLNKLENNTFEGWREDEKNAYLTCLISIKEFIKNNENRPT